MVVYKRTLGDMVSGVLGAVMLSVLSYFIINAFVDNPLFADIGSVLVFIGLFWLFVVSASIKAEVSEDSFTFFKRGKAVVSFDPRHVSLRYYIRTSRNNTSITLYYIDESGVEKELDCSPFGKKQFMKMWDSFEKEPVITPLEVE